MKNGLTTQILSPITNENPSYFSIRIERLQSHL